MIAKITIELKKTKEESIVFLKSNTVTLTHQTLFGNSIEHIAVWKNLENPSNFKFVLKSLGRINPWWGKCSLVPSKLEDRTILSLIILPPLFFLFFLGATVLGVVYTVVVMGINNYDKPTFVPSIIIVSLIFGGVFLFWRLIAKINAEKIKKDIITSFESQPEKP